MGGIIIKKKAFDLIQNRLGLASSYLELNPAPSTY